jgi:hypothetical protein
MGDSVDSRDSPDPANPGPDDPSSDLQTTAHRNPKHPPKLRKPLPLGRADERAGEANWPSKPQNSRFYPRLDVDGEREAPERAGKARAREPSAGNSTASEREGCPRIAQDPSEVTDNHDELLKTPLPRRGSDHIS